MNRKDIEKIIELLEKENKSYTIKEIKEILSLQGLNSTNLAYELSTHNNVIILNKKPKQYKSEKFCSQFTGEIKKEKNFLKFMLDNGESVNFDFEKNSFVTDMNNMFLKNDNSNIIVKIFFDNNCTNSLLRSLEWLYNYIEYVDFQEIRNRLYFSSEKVLELLQKCPKGYINFIKENNLRINTETIKLFHYVNKYTNLPQKLIYNMYDSYKAENRIELANKYWKICNIEKLLKNSIANFDLSIENNFYKLIDIMAESEKENFDFISIINPNRDLKFNIKILQSEKNKEKNKAISKNLQKLNFLQNLIFDNYIVVIPQTVENLVEEGKQQNNCVGYYYNDDILNNKDLIYFLRDKNNKEKSVVTCRYNMIHNSTVEHRTKNNYDTNEQQNNIINLIDEIIKENLKNC